MLTHVEALAHFRVTVQNKLRIVAENYDAHAYRNKDVIDEEDIKVVINACKLATASANGLRITSADSISHAILTLSFVSELYGQFKQKYP